MTNSERARSVLLSEGWSPEEAEKVVEALKDILDSTPKAAFLTKAPSLTPAPDPHAFEA